MTKKKHYYAVKNGRNIGIFETRKEFKKSIHKFSNAIFQKFTSKEAAEKWLNISNPKNEPIIEKVGESRSEAIAYVNGCFKDDVFTYGLVIAFNNQKLTFKEKFINKQWAKMKNVSGEIMGVIKAIQVAVENKINSLLIHHDFIGVENWADNKWNTKKPEIIVYQNFVVQNRENITIKFVKVETHKGNKSNQYAIQLANEAFNLTSFSSILLDSKQYDEAKNSLSTIDSNTITKTSNIIPRQEKELEKVELQLKRLMNGNEVKLNAIVRIFLLSSLANLNCQKKSFEYSDVCFQSLKAIEAQIFEIFQKYPVFSRVASKNSYTFSKVFKKDKGKFSMNTKYANGVRSLKIVSILERMYTIYNMERNTIFHSSLILLQTRTISTIEEAESIIMDCINLINEYYT